MTARLGEFRDQVDRARDLIGLAQSFRSATFGVVDSTDMLRASLVQAVAALDHYCHGVILDRAVDILMGRIPSGSSSTIGIPFDSVRQILSAGTTADQELAARTHIAQRLARETFQRSESVASGFAMVGIPKLWSRAFANPSMAITALNLVVDRRNSIVHQGDADPLNPGSVTPLSESDALEAVSTIDSHVTAIDSLC